MQIQDDIYELEEILDRQGLVQLLGMLESICYDKAQHLMENWQDMDTAKVWERDAKKIGNLSEKVESPYFHGYFTWRWQSSNGKWTKHS